jgi:hypothetical protein
VLLRYVLKGVWYVLKGVWYVLKGVWYVLKGVCLRGEVPARSAAHVAGGTAIDLVGTLVVKSTYFTTLLLCANEVPAR